MHFTSGTTGTPKGAIHVHEAVIAHYITGKYALDLHPDDVFWCTADPGWVTGTSYGIIAPLSRRDHDRRRGDFDAERWYAHSARSESHGVVHRADGDPHADAGRRRDGANPGTFDTVRFMASVGEPLNPEAVVWSDEKLGQAVSRQLVADRNRRHHDREFRQRGHQVGLDGPAASGIEVGSWCGGDTVCAR